METIWFVRYTVKQHDGRAMERTTLMRTTITSRLHPIQQAEAMVKALHPAAETVVIDVLGTNNTCYDYTGKQHHISLMPHATDTFDVDKWLDGDGDDEPETNDDDVDKTPVFAIDPTVGPLPSGSYVGVLRADESDDDGVPRFLFTDIRPKE